MNINVAKERMSSVIKPDSITASKGDFLATHVEIKKLNILNRFSLLPDTNEFFSEEQVYKSYILNPNNQHQFIAVYGQSGTGKSHLIRWFEAKYQNEKPEDEVVLFIRRSDNTLKGTIRQLLAMPEVSGISNKEVYDRLVKATVYEDENKLKGRIYHDFINEIEYDDGSKDIRLSNIKKKRLTAFLVNEVVQSHMMSSDGPIGRIYSKIAENTMVDRDTIAQFQPVDFYVSIDLFEKIQQAGADRKAESMALELMSEEDGQEDAKKIASYLNQFSNDVIQRCAGIEAGDFRLIFQDIRRELYKLGKNLTLFIEDVTSFTGVDDALLDALIVEHTGMNETDQLCRISSIVGTTSNYLQNNFRDNHKDRITKFIYIPSDVFDEDGIFEFVGRYLNTMSLEEYKITDWLERKAKDSEYPVHEVVDGALWETVKLNDGKVLNLYPFTRHAIRYLYNNRLGKGHQTPRYIIRDIIEPVVSEIITAKENFPSDKFKLASTNVTLSMLIHNKVKDQKEADRLTRFLSIWGDADPTQYEENGNTYISSINKKILSELNFPEITFKEEKKEAIPKKVPEVLQTPIKPATSNVPEKKIKAISQEKLENIDKVNNFLTKWSNGETIDISANLGVSRIIKSAQSDISAYIFSAINWKTEGVSVDNIDKIKKTYKNNFLKLENQLKGDGVYTLPANWESVHLLMAFVRWRELGKSSWNYPEADLDAFIVTGWLSKVKNEIVEIVKSQNKDYVPYIEAAMIAEIYGNILVGSYSGKTLKEYDRKDLLGPNSAYTANSLHSQEWKSLISLISQKGADEINRETIQQYFNLPQGEASKMLVLDDLALETTLTNIKASGLKIDESALDLSDSVKLRRDTYLYLKGIADRIDKVAKAELAGASGIVKEIYNFVGDDEIEEEDIVDILAKIKEFYEEINKTQINIPTVSVDDVKNNVTNIEKAIESVGKVLDEKDTLSILLAFSDDPLSDIMPLHKLLKKVQSNIADLEQKMISSKNQLGVSTVFEDVTSKYQNEQKIIANGLLVFDGGQF